MLELVIPLFIFNNKQDIVYFERPILAHIYT